MLILLFGSFCSPFLTALPFQRKEFAQKLNTHAVQQLGEILPVLQPVQRSKARVITEVRPSSASTESGLMFELQAEKKHSAFQAQRVARAEAHLIGKRLRQAEAKKAEAEMKKKE